MTGAVCASLDALAAHLASLPSRAYAAATDDLGGATIGMHVRHCLDHYATLLGGLRTGRFDYDDRQRDGEVECDRACASALARSLRRELREALRGVDLGREVQVRAAIAADGQVAWHRSSLGRELQFVTSHTVHHSAMVAASCRLRGLPVVDGFGVAPSTLRFRAAADL